MATTAEILQQYKQFHILELLASGKQFRALENIDLESFLKNAKQPIPSPADSGRVTHEAIEVFPIESIQEIENKKNKFYTLGTSQLKEAKLAVIILSGGQGSRLGYHHAKGMYDVGITRNISIFELLVNSLSRRAKDLGIPIPLFIMTSDDNHEEIQQFFDQHNYFGYPEQFIEFFIQNKYPALDSEGKIYLTQDKELLMLPSGNGDWYKMLAESGILDKPEYSRVEWFNVVSVDNPLQNMADPMFLGATLSASCDVGTKVIKKSNAGRKNWRNMQI